MNNKNSLIFVVEDDLPCAMLIKYCLARNGYNNVHIYSNEKVCLSDMSMKPDILITDYRLKGMNGIELIKKAKRIFPFFYCIMLSGIPADEIFGNNINNRLVDKYIRKSLNCMAELHSSIEEYLEPVFLRRG